MPAHADAALIVADAYTHLPELAAAINSSDKVYRNDATGRHIKVRVLRQPNPPGLGFGALVYQISGAHCGPDGKALRHGAESFQIAPAMMLTVQSDASIDLSAHLEVHRKQVCAATERAVLMEQAAAQL